MLGGAKKLLQILYFGWTSPSIININNIQFTDIQPRATFDTLKKKEVIQFDIKSKQWVFHSDKGTIPVVESKSSIDTLPDGNSNKINIDVNEEFSNVKERLFVLDDENSVMHYGTIKLQRQLLDSLTKANFNCVVILICRQISLFI